MSSVDITVYPSPYIVLSNKGYTKHFYVGAEKVATLLGDGGIFDNSYSINIEDKKRIAGAFAEQLSGITTGLNKMQLGIIDLTGNEDRLLQYECDPYDEIDIRTRITPNLFGDLLNNIGDKQPASFPNDIYYTHSNHLGSASWITDKTGTPIQYIHYAPYGELIANQQATGYDERFKFTGKERDSESGYNYHGARFLWGDAGFWLSVDPLADKYPGLTPYLYCNGNPIMLVDPDGRSSFSFMVVAATQPEILVPAALLVGATAGIYFAYHPEDAGAAKQAALEAWQHVKAETKFLGLFTYASLSQKFNPGLANQRKRDKDNSDMARKQMLEHRRMIKNMYNRNNNNDNPKKRVLAGVLTSLELVQKWRSAVDVDPELYKGLIDNYNKVERADKTGDCTEELIKALEEQHIKFLDSIPLDTVDNNQQ